MNARRYLCVDTQMVEHARNRLQSRFPVRGLLIAHKIYRYLFLAESLSTRECTFFSRYRFPVLCSCVSTLRDSWKQFRMCLWHQTPLILTDLPPFSGIAQKFQSTAILFFLLQAGGCHIPAVAGGLHATPSFLMSALF
jgi:hypothetical protein